MAEQCVYCGSESFEAKRIPYLYQHQGRSLRVPDMPAEVCAQCGMEYFPGPDLEAAERHFFAIQRAEVRHD